MTKTEFAGSNLILELSKSWLSERITLPQGIHLQEIHPVSTEYLILGQEFFFAVNVVKYIFKAGVPTEDENFTRKTKDISP